jgi:hypothetical protein
MPEDGVGEEQPGQVPAGPGILQDRPGSRGQQVGRVGTAGVAGGRHRADRRRVVSPAVIPPEPEVELVLAAGVVVEAASSSSARPRPSLIAVPSMTPLSSRSSRNDQPAWIRQRAAQS